ncbi:MAG: septum site-determining protein MinC [Lachnospiraceae bacterium]|nr:septum site-determining protein MinC [Lachnospiraceae bacterium]
MTEDVIIKGYPHGIRLVMNPDIPIEQLLTSVCVKFASSKGFWGEASMSLTIEGRNLSNEELEAVIQSIERNSHIRISLVSTKDRFFEKEMSRKKDAFYFQKTGDYLKIHDGSVKNGEKIISNYGLLITGDIETGATAECGGSLVVLGTIAGKAYAGRETGKSAFVLTAGIQEADISIGSVRENFSVKNRTRLLSKKNHLIIVTVEDGHLSPEEFTGKVNV